MSRNWGKLTRQAFREALENDATTSPGTGTRNYVAGYKSTRTSNPTTGRHGRYLRNAASKARRKGNPPCGKGGR